MLSSSTTRVLCCGVIGLTLGLGLNQAASARGETIPPRQDCAKLSLEKKSLEARGVRQFLKLPPAVVQRDHGAQTIERVRSYISVREKVLFECPKNIRNANAAIVAQRVTTPPPLPVQGPFRPPQTAARASVTRASGPRAPVPLPVQRQPRN